MRRISWQYLVLIVGLVTTSCNANVTSTNTTAPSTVVQWDRDPSTIVFQADIVGGDQRFVDLNDIPRCTIYGDNRVIWVDDSNPRQRVVLTDVLTDETIIEFAGALSSVYAIYDYEDLARIQLPTDTRPVYEQLIFNVNNREHLTDGFAPWPPSYFRDIMLRCMGLSQQPALFEPTAGWISAIESVYKEDHDFINWNANASGLSLAELAAETEPRWIDTDNVVILWHVINNTSKSRLFLEDGGFYEVALQVPNLTRDAPQIPN